MGRGIHKKLRAILARKGDSLPDARRAGHNHSYRLSDALICAFCIFFFQHPSALAFQRQMQEKRRRNNIASIFGVEEIPSDTWIKTLLDRIEPDAFGGVFDDSLRAAEEGGALDSYRVLDDGVLIALDGVWYHSSEKISCKRCLHVTKGDRTDRIGFEKILHINTGKLKDNISNAMTSSFWITGQPQPWWYPNFR